MANSFTKIASYTLTSPSSLIDFISIPSIYQDLVLMISRRAVDNVLDDGIRFNNDASNVYSFTQMQSGASSGGVGTARNSNATLTRSGGQQPSTYTAGIFNSTTVWIPNYRSGGFKTIIAEGADENQSTTSYQWFHAGLWRNNAAIDRITIYQEPGGNMATGTSATLYGLKPTA